MGARAAFKDLSAGSFLNFNRTNRTGHGVIFLGFLNRFGVEVPSFSSDVAGFKYFSSNGLPNRPGGASGSGGLSLTTQVVLGERYRFGIV